MARLYAARGICDCAELDYGLKALLPYQDLKNIQPMASRLADAVAAGQRLLVVADYDADGATACAVAVKGLSMLGARVDFIVPNRFEYGYGLTPEIVELAARQNPDIIVTVDNGIASVDGVLAAKARGIEVLVTDHHLPGDVLPEALIVNPNQPGCEFPSKNLAGVGVMFYVLLALRAEMRRRGVFDERGQPNLGELLDYVALGTVADVVRLDQNNRTLVENGLKRMRAGRMTPGIAALFRVAGRAHYKANTFDLGFTLGPRLNAAGRLDDMSLGIACLLAANEEQAMRLAQQLDQLNRERRSIEHGMQDEALAALSGIDADNRYTLSLFRDDWHQGVVGIVASRLKNFHRPAIVFAPGDDGEIRARAARFRFPSARRAGSGVQAPSRPDPQVRRPCDGGRPEPAASAFRRIPARLRGGGARTAGRAPSDPHHRNRWRPGAAQVNLVFAEQLAAEVWGQGFPVPYFHDRFAVMSQRVVGDKHLKLRLARDGEEYDAMLFNQVEWAPDNVDAVYQLIANEWQGRKELQVYLQHGLRCELALLVLTGGPGAGKSACWKPCAQPDIR